MRTQNTRSRQAGVGLIELMVSVLVLSIGLVALARLQIELVRGAADSRARSAAVALAEEKLEDLRSYAVLDGPGAWSTTASPQAWSWIDDNAGGRIAAQTRELEGVNYTLSWAVSSITYTSSVGPALGVPTDYKDVTITVAWEDADADTPTQQVQLTGSIMGIPPGNVIAASQPVAEPPSGPEVLYTPGEAPEVISVPIDVGGNRRRETTKPLPTVVGGSGTNVVRFDVVNYHQNGLQFIVDKREEFVTLNCTCEVAASGPARTPARTVFQFGTVHDVPGKVVTKPRGIYTETGSSAQPLCTICCRDHHDYSDSDGNHFFNPDDASAHAHYLMSSSTSPVSSGNYDEACRLKRVNGVFQVFEDWRLNTMTVLPGDFLTNTSTLDTYVDYVQRFVEHRVLGSSLPTKPAGRDTTVQSGAIKQLFTRALYVEVPDGLADFINDELIDPDNEFEDYLDLIPFYEINLTKLANWSSRNRSVVRVTSSSVRTEAINQDAYSRGRAGGVPSTLAETNSCQPTPGSLSAVDVRLIASLRLGNTGVTATTPISPSEDEDHPRLTGDGCNPLELPTGGPPANRQLYYATAVDPESPDPAEHRDDSVLVTYLPPGSPGISGDIFKSSIVTAGDPQLEVTDVRFEGTSNGSCVLNVVGANVDYSCVVPAGWIGRIVFSPGTLTYCGDDSCAEPHPDGRVEYGPVFSGLAGQTVWVQE